MNTDRGTHWPITDDLAALRQRIRRYATRAGLTGTRREDLLLAANEAVINVLEHGGGVGTVTLWHDERGLSVEITDTAGLLAPHDVHRERPVPRADRGFGLWLMGRCVMSSPSGRRPDDPTSGSGCACAPPVPSSPEATARRRCGRAR
ncbi:ATP-binding protein [Streptosporangium lutulentum]